MTLTLDRQKEKIMFASRIIILFIICSALFIPIASAGKDNSIPWGMVEQILTGPAKDITDTLNSKADGVSLYRYVSSETFINDKFSDIYKILKGLGFLWAFGIAFMNMLNGIEQGQDPIEQVFKALVELAVVGIILLNLNKVINLVCELGAYVVDTIMSSDVLLSDQSASISDILIGIDGGAGKGEDTGGIGWFLKEIVLLFLPWAATAIISILGKFVIIQIVIEIAIRKIFVPLAVADIYKEGLRSPGMRYLKRLFAVYIKLAVCCIVTIVVNVLTVCLLSSDSPVNGVSATLSYLFSVVTINFTAVGLMFKGSEIANDIVGS